METDATIGKLTATKRYTKGKGVARKLRAEGLIPAVCYGIKAESIPLTVDPALLKKALDPDKRRNTVIQLTIKDGKKSETLQVMLKEYQVDTIKDAVLHADFIQVSLEQTIEVSVPLLLQGRPEGVKLGGTLHQVFRTLPLKCKPADIPASLSADVSALELNESISVRDLELPEGVMINLPENQTIGLVMAPRKVEEEEVAAAEEAEEGAEGAEGAEDKDKDKKEEEKPAAKRGEKAAKG
jgi:large subunit ribosomal protein L25